jgi:hypothetical protein
MGRHGNLLLRGDSVLSPPETGDGLPLSVESEAVLAVEVRGAGTGDALLVSGEAEHGQRHGDGHIHANLTGLKRLLEQRRRGARLRKYGRTIAVGVGIDQVDSLFCGLDVQAHQHRSKDLFGVTFHMWFNIGDDCRADLQVECSSVECL